MTGKLIVIEGGDGAGKETQAKLALEALRQVESTIGPVFYFDFPNYDSLAGGTIRRALDREYGDFRNLHPRLASAPFTIDRAVMRDPLRAALEKGHALLNRYTPSNAMYQAAKFDEELEQQKFIMYMEMLEYEDLKLPKPDLVLYLHVPFEISHELARARGKLDQHEADEAYQRKVISLYQQTANERPDIWKIIQCTSSEGELLPREEIHHRVMRRITPLLQ